MSTKKIIEELEKINKSQPTLVAAALLAIRARMEAKTGIANRIGKMFPNGNRGVLFVGKAGVGKTRFMEKVFNGLGLSGTNKEGQVIGKWLPSTGGSTGVGIHEVLETYNDAIIFADELSLDTQKHVHIMKQIANGELVRPRHGNIEATPFSGLLIGATNAIKLPSNTRELEHLLATLDRFIVVNTKATLNTPEETMQIVLSDEKEPEPDWAMLAKALTRKSIVDLTKREKDLLQKTWNEKSRQILDGTRAQWRNSQTVLDIFLFCKRFFGIQDLIKDKIALKFIDKMVDDCVLFNPIGLLHLSPLEQIIYDCIKGKEVVSTSEIVSAVSTGGLSSTRMTIHRTINRMQESNLIVRRSHGKYSTKQPQKAYNKTEESETNLGELLQPAQSQEVKDLMDSL